VDHLVNEVLDTKTEEAEEVKLTNEKDSSSADKAEPA